MGDASKVKADLGWVPEVSFHQLVFEMPSMILSRLASSCPPQPQTCSRGTSLLPMQAEATPSWPWAGRKDWRGSDVSLTRLHFPLRQVLRCKYRNAAFGARAM